MPTVEKALSEMPRLMAEFDATEEQIPALEAELEKLSEKAVNAWNGAIIAVGAGHGFVVQGTYDDRYVITAVQCLPWLPHSAGERYPDLLGTVGGERTVAAGCCFADPISDIAVLDNPDDGLFPSEDWSKYLEFTDAAIPLTIAHPPLASLAWIPSPDGRWLHYIVRSGRGRDLLIVPIDNVHLKMAGVPIVSDDGTAIGVLCPGPVRKFLRPDHPGLAGSIPERLWRHLAIPASSPLS